MTKEGPRWTAETVNKQIYILPKYIVYFQELPIDPSEIYTAEQGAAANP